MTLKKEFNEIIAKGMVDDINLLSPQEHNQILTFIKNDGVKYMENENGVFIKMNQLIDINSLLPTISSYGSITCQHYVKVYDRYDLEIYACMHTCTHAQAH